VALPPGRLRKAHRGMPQRETAKARYRQHRERKRKRLDPTQQHKRDRLGWIIRYHHLEVDEPSRQRAEKSIVHYELAAIAESEEAFLRAIRRDAAPNGYARLVTGIP